ncbi:MAG: MaoC family dehydratase N-terminal domain-containing protein [Pseudomonadota bacterium]
MVKSDMEVEARMAPEERELFERYKALIGKPYTPPNEQEAMENMIIYFWDQGREVTKSYIRRWAAVNEDYNALYFDEEYAKNSRWGGLIAPPLYLISVQDGLAAPMELYYEIAMPEGMAYNTEKFPNLVSAPQGYTEWEFFEAVRPGDVIDADHKLSDIYWKAAKPKKGRPFEFTRILFIVAETTYTNQNGELVARSVSCGTTLWK